jgi:hypothetical protein
MLLELKGQNESKSSEVDICDIRDVVDDQLPSTSAVPSKVITRKNSNIW